MRIPSVPNGQLIDGRGHPTPQFRVWMSELINQMQHFVSDDSTILPTKTKEQINQLNTAANQSKFVGGILHDNEELNMKVKTESGKDYKPLNTYEELTNAEMLAIPSGQRNGRVVKNTDAGAHTYIGSGDTFVRINN
jgi:hypothetical protein